MALSACLFTTVAASQSPPAVRGTADLAAYPWLYLRQGEPLGESERVVEVIAVGDVMLGRGVAEVHRLGSAAPAQPFAAVVAWLRAADVTLGNLECVVGASGSARPGPYRLLAPPSTAAVLREAGFDIMGLANNHSLDLGPSGLAETVSRLEAAGISTFGVGRHAGAAAEPLVREVDGLRLAFMAFNSVLDPLATREAYSGWTWARWDRREATSAIAAARAHVDAVIVSIHWGYEYELRVDPAQREVARAMMDAGADLVIGHHPHVVQMTGVYHGRFVAYSLGNFIFDQQQGETRQGLALRAFFDGNGLRAVQAVPVCAGLRPRLMPLSEADPLLARVRSPLRRIGFVCGTTTESGGYACHPVHVSQTPRVGLFRVGALDLTGDGISEQVRREEEQVVVYREGTEVWRGLREWRVLDLALGDPNDDGRGELMVALLKPDATGVPRSHPFMIGHRGGAYRILWGGSAVADTIREVELGDVDGDGVHELIVLEELSHGCGARCSSCVSVWRWHGWGFALMWRSPCGRYRDLVLAPGRTGSELAITVAVER